MTTDEYVSYCMCAIATLFVLLFGALVLSGVIGLFLTMRGVAW